MGKQSQQIVSVKKMHPEVKESASVQKSQARVLNDEDMNDEEEKNEAVEGDDEDRAGSDAEGQDQDAIDKEREEEKRRKKEKFYNEVDNEEFF